MKLGTVIKLPVKNTNPPKDKYLILLSRDNNKVSYAYLFINSEINLTVNDSPELQALQYPLAQANNTFLHHDSFADCAKVDLKDVDEIEKSIQNGKATILGEVNATDLKNIYNMVKNAETTKPLYLNIFFK